MAKQFKKAAVFGGGIMGPGIAQILAFAGLRVCLYDISAEALERAKSRLYTGLVSYAEQKIIKESQIDLLYERVTYTTDLTAALQDTDLVFEAVSENPKIKELVYQQLDDLAPAELVIASNTSFLNIFELMPERRMPYTVIAHWYAPAQMIPLVEVCPNEQTEPWVSEAVMKLLQDGGKSPVLMKRFIQGYIINRLQMCLNQEVFYLLDHGYCTPQDIDLAVKSSLIPRAMVLGLCQRMDFAGLNMYANNLRNKVYTAPPVNDMPKTLQERLDRGETGVQAGKGFYNYCDRDVSELLAKRDRQLYEAFQLEQKFMSDPL